MFYVEKKKAESTDASPLEKVYNAFKQRKRAKFGFFAVCKRRDRSQFTKAADRIEPELDIVSFIQK